MIKALFITHDISIYGASRSLQTLLRNYSAGDIRIDLMINRRILGKNDIPAVSKLFGPHVQNIYEGYLPFESVVVGTPKGSSGLFVKNLFYRLNRGKLLRWLRREKYDVVHLNSLVMHSLITEDLPFLIHVRELFDLSEPSVLTSLHKARGIIFIDDSTRKPFLNEKFNHSIVLNNPFDMKPGSQVAGERLLRLANERRTVIAMIGKIKDSKGNLFVLRSFMKSAMKERGVLLFVGEADDDAFLSQCKAESGPGENVVYYGEETDIEQIYAVSDFIIRGEPYPCIGRTIFEGLYSGCHVIIPGTANDFPDTFDDSLKAFVHYYEPGSESALSSLLTSLNGTKVMERKYRSNARDYVEQFHLFLKKAINRTGR